MPDEAGLTWVTVDDFSPGIYNAPGMERSGSFTGFRFTQTAPIGAARDDTYGCLPTSDGHGLVPGYYSNHANDLTFVTATLADANNQAPFVISGFAIANFGGLASVPFIAVLYRSTTNHMTWKLLRSASTLARTVTDAGTTQVFVGSELVFTRASSASPYTVAGNPVLAYSYPSSGAVVGEAGFYPDPAAPTVNGVAAFGLKGLVIAHQNRVIIVESLGAYSLGGLSVSDSGERLSFTDPANSNVMGTQQQVFYPEQSTGVSAWASLTAGQLLLIKRIGGAVLLEGDVAAPRASSLPAVQSTGNLVSRACVSPVGIVYGSDGAGAWAWQGGSTSKKISSHLDDEFYRHQQPDARTYFDSAAPDGPNFQAMYYNNHIFVSGGWIMDIATGGWWRLDDPSNSTAQFMWYGIDLFGSGTGNPYLYAIHPKANFVSGTTYRYGYRYQLGIYASTYFWHSHAIPAGQPGKDVWLQEVVVNAQRDDGATGTARFTITIYGYGGATQTLAVTTVSVSDRPTTFRFPCSIHGDALEFSILCENTTDGQPAPMIHNVKLGYVIGNEEPAL